MLLVGFSLAQIGEFSLITAKVGFGSGILSETIYQEFLAVTVLSMVLTPFFSELGQYFAVFSQRLSLPKILVSDRYRAFNERELACHVSGIETGSLWLSCRLLFWCSPLRSADSVR